MAGKRLEQRHKAVRTTFPQAKNQGMERAMGIEPTSSAWKAVALPLSYARILQTIYEMFLSQARQFVPVLIPRRHAALAASRLYRDMVGNSRQPGNHLLANPGFFSLSRSSATSVPFNLHGDPPNLEFSRHAACHESTEVMPGIRIRNCLAVRHDGKPRPHGVFDNLVSVITSWTALPPA